MAGSNYFKRWQEVWPQMDIFDQGGVDYNQAITD